MTVCQAPSACLPSADLELGHSNMSNSDAFSPPKLLATLTQGASALDVR